MTSRSYKLLIPALAIVLLVILVAWMSGVFSTRLQPGLEINSRTMPDNLFAISLQEVALQEPVPASVAARDTTMISARLLARINAIHVRSGDQVQADQLLVELEKADLTAIARQAGERIKAFEAQLLEAESTLARNVRLLEQRAASKSDLDRALAARDSLTAQLEASRQALEEAESAVSYSQIRSPIDGRIVDRFAEPGDTASPGMPLLSLYNPLSLQVEAQVRETLALTLQLGQTLIVEIPALNKQFSTVVQEMVPAAESGSRSFLIKARISQGEQLLPGMYARLLLPSGSEQQILIPETSVARIGQLEVVRVWQNNTLQRRFVRLGDSTANGMVQVISGLQAGELVAAEF